MKTRNKLLLVVALGVWLVVFNTLSTFAENVEGPASSKGEQAKSAIHETDANHSDSEKPITRGHSELGHLQPGNHPKLLFPNIGKKPGAGYSSFSPKPLFKPKSPTQLFTRPAQGQSFAASKISGSKLVATLSHKALEQAHPTVSLGGPASQWRAHGSATAMLGGPATSSVKQNGILNGTAMARKP